MLKTEMRNPKTVHIDKMTTLDMVRVMNEENAVAVEAVGAALPRVARAVDAVAEALMNGGRLIYMGAGTSGRLGVIDAAECPPTFGVSPDLIVGIIAGGERCMFRAAESQEDDAAHGVADLKEKDLTSRDVVVGISAAGGAAYVIGALEYAKSLGCVTVGLTSNADTLLDKTADISIVTDTGAEVITGSTRLKAGTAQKLVLNMISTCAMVKCGHVYENLMINLRPTNQKLRGRMVRIVAAILDVDEQTATARLDANEWNIRRAVEQ